VAVDIGGTKLAAGVVDSTGRVWHAARVPTPVDGDGAVVWAALAGLIGTVRAAAATAGAPEPVGVGVGCGGPMRWPSGMVSPLNIPGWREFPLRDRLGEVLGLGPVRVHNDAIALAVAEHWRGAAVGMRNALGMVVSTGVGGGLVLGDRVVDGASGNAGHIGHVVVDPAGPECACGGRGCLEAIAAGPRTVAWALANGWRGAVADKRMLGARARYGESAADKRMPGARARYGESAAEKRMPGATARYRESAAEKRMPGATARYRESVADGRALVADARAGDAVAVAALARSGAALGVGIASALALCDVQVVVLGGGLAAAGALLFDPLREALARHARLGFTQAVPVVASALGPDAGLIGAAALVLAGDRYWSAG
jgi:glucokinase